MRRKILHRDRQPDRCCTDRARWKERGKERERQRETKREREKTESPNQCSVHQWVRFAIHASQQLTVIIGSYSYSYPWNFHCYRLSLKFAPPPCSVLRARMCALNFWTRAQKLRVHLFGPTNVTVRLVSNQKGVGTACAAGFFLTKFACDRFWF